MVPHVVLDGKVFRTDRCAETTTSTKGAAINAWDSSQLDLPALADSGYDGAGHATRRPLASTAAHPRRIGDYVKAALVLTHIEQVQLRTTC